MMKVARKEGSFENLKTRVCGVKSAREFQPAFIQWKTLSSEKFIKLKGRSRAVMLCGSGQSYQEESLR